MTLNLYNLSQALYQLSYQIQCFYRQNIRLSKIGQIGRCDQRNSDRHWCVYREPCKMDGLGLPSYGARNRRPSNTPGPSSAEGSDRGDSPFRPPMTSTMATPDEGTNEDSTRSKKRKKGRTKEHN